MQTNPLISLKGATKTDLTFLVNEQEHIIPIQIAALQDFFQSFGQQTFQAADKIYNIGEIGTANFHLTFHEIAAKLKQLNRIPTLMPPKVIGREKDLAEVRRLLMEQNTLVIVNGLGGMGKTVLSHYYWQQYKEQYKHLLWLDGEKDLEEELLKDHLLHLNLQITEKIAPYLAAKNGGNYHEARQQALDLIHHSLAALDEPCLMMIDNADKKHFWTIKEYAENLPNFHILITSRNEMTDVHTHFLEGVSEADALTLFYLYYDFHKKHPHNDTLVAQICKAAGYHTLTIECLAKTLANRHDLTFETLLAELDEHIVYLKKKFL